MHQLALHFFGTPRVELDGAPVTIHRLKAVALLAYLAVTCQVHSRDVLATLFWQDSDPVHAHDNLRNCVAELHRALAGNWLVADRLYVALPASQVLWVDVHHFRDLLATNTTHGHLASATCPDCLPVLHKAAASIQRIFYMAFPCRIVLPLRNGSGWRLKIYGRSSRPSWIGWRKVTPRTTSMRQPSPVRSAAWRWTGCTSLPIER